MELRLCHYLLLLVFVGTWLPSSHMSGGGIPEEGLSATHAMAFIAEEIPELHAEIEILLNQMPEMSEAVHETVTAIHEDYLRFTDMSSELAQIFLTIKKREFQNQIMAEKIQSLTDPKKRSSEFNRLTNHMNVTFDLHLKLVKGELAWLEREVEGLKDLVESEQENKSRLVREDLEAVLLKNNPLLRISISGLGEKQTQEQQAALKKLIEGLAPTDSKE